MNDSAPRYQHVQPGPDAYDEPYREALTYLSGAVLQMASSPNLYTTKSTAKELQKTVDYLAQLKLEEQLYSQASCKWRNQFTEREIVTQRQALLNLKNKLTDPGGQFLQRYRINMDHGNVLCGDKQCATNELGKRTDQDNGIGWTDTSMRAAHAWAEQELGALNSELEPLATGARRRIEQYVDVMDITDRYSGYRRNMAYMRKRDPSDLVAFENTMDTCTRPQLAPRWYLGSDWTRAEAVGTQNFTAPGDWNDCRVNQQKFMERYELKTDSREAAGIQLRFPGRSEYQDEYLIPTFVETGMDTTMPPTTHRATFDQPAGVRGRGSMVGIDPAQVQIKDYLVNPVPDYLVEFNKTTELDSKTTEFPISETKDSFRWPKASQLGGLTLPME